MIYKCSDPTDKRQQTSHVHTAPTDTDKLHTMTAIGCLNTGLDKATAENHLYLSVHHK